MEGEGVLGQVDPGQVVQGQVGALAGRGLGGAEDHGNCIAKLSSNWQFHLKLS